MISIRITDKNDNILYELFDKSDRDQLSNDEISQIAKSLSDATDVYLKYDDDKIFYRNRMHIHIDSDDDFKHVVKALDDMFNMRVAVSQVRSLLCGFGVFDNYLFLRSHVPESAECSRSHVPESAECSRSHVPESAECSYSCDHKSSCPDIPYSCRTRNMAKEFAKKIASEHSQEPEKKYLSKYGHWETPRTNNHNKESPNTPPETISKLVEHANTTRTQAREKTQTSMADAETGSCKEWPSSYATDKAIADFIGYLRTQPSWATLINKLRFCNDPNDPTGKAELITEFHKHIKKNKNQTHRKKRNKTQ